MTDTDFKTEYGDECEVSEYEGKTSINIEIETGGYNSCTHTVYLNEKDIDKINKAIKKIKEDKK